MLSVGRFAGFSPCLWERLRKLREGTVSVYERGIRQPFSTWSGSKVELVGIGNESTNPDKTLPFTGNTELTFLKQSLWWYHYQTSNSHTITPGLQPHAGESSTSLATPGTAATCWVWLPWQELLFHMPLMAFLCVTELKKTGYRLGRQEVKRNLNSRGNLIPRDQQFFFWNSDINSCQTYERNQTKLYSSFTWALEKKPRSAGLGDVCMHLSQSLMIFRNK